MNERHGVIYILTNPSFPDYVKIGYADDIKKRLRQLNRSECIPFAFRVYATYEVTSRLSDLKIHAIIDKLNPTLRSIENFNGQKRVREFYAMSPEDAYDILAAIAEIHGCEDKLKLVPPNDEEVEAAETAEEIEEQKKERLTPFAFSLCQIPVGATIEYSNRADVKSGRPAQSLTITPSNMMEKDGSLSALATCLHKVKWSVGGPRYLQIQWRVAKRYSQKAGNH